MRSSLQVIIITTMTNFVSQIFVRISLIFFLSLVSQILYWQNCACQFSEMLQFTEPCNLHEILYWQLKYFLMLLWTYHFFKVRNRVLSSQWGCKHEKILRILAHVFDLNSLSRCLHESQIDRERNDKWHTIVFLGGCNIEGEEESWDFGTGAGFYVDATEEKWKTNYRMFSYVTQEVNKTT